MVKKNQINYPNLTTMKASSHDRRALVLYVRVDCHLCQEMHGELLPWSDKLGFGLEIVDIDRCASLVNRYDYKVPVLCEGDEEICHHFLDEDMLLQHFGWVS